MILDDQNKFEDGAAITGSGNSAFVVDSLGNHDLGTGEQLRLLLNVTGKTGTSPTLDIDLVGADDESFSVNPITIASSPTISANGLYDMAIPRHKQKRFYRLEYTLGGTGSPGYNLGAFIARHIDSTPGIGLIP